MKSIADEFEKLAGSDFLDRLAMLQEEIERHPAVQELREQYPNRKIALTDLGEFAKMHDCCKGCVGLEGCKSLVKGHCMVPKESMYVSSLSFAYKPCEAYSLYEQQKKTRRLIKSHSVPEHILNMTFKDIEFDTARRQAIFESMNFCESYKPGTVTGLYLHGPMGVGKSAIGGAIANELAKRNIEVLMVYVPEFLGEIKAAIKTGEVEEKLSALKEVPVLILDDIGAESLTAWTRDDVIGTILQKRMEKLPTVFTSNLNLSELEGHLARAKDEGYPNKTKAARIMERIDPFVKEVRVTGINRRRQKN